MGNVRYGDWSERMIDVSSARSAAPWEFLFIDTAGVAMMIVGAGVSLYAHISLTNECA